MKIKVDNREKENEHIIKIFEQQQIEYITNKPCSIGDYCNLEKPNIFIERKASWLEFAGNCGKAHDRFKRELERLDECGGKLFIMVEEKTLIEEWKNQHSKMNGKIMAKIIECWKRKHNIEIVQTTKENAGYLILELLGGRI